MLYRAVEFQPCELQNRSQAKLSPLLSTAQVPALRARLLSVAVGGTRGAPLSLIALYVPDMSWHRCINLDWESRFHPHLIRIDSRFTWVCSNGNVVIVLKMAFEDSLGFCWFGCTWGEFAGNRQDKGVHRQLRGFTSRCWSCKGRRCCVRCLLQATRVKRAQWVQH